MINIHLPPWLTTWDTAAWTGIAILVVGLLLKLFWERLKLRLHRWIDAILDRLPFLRLPESKETPAPQSRRPLPPEFHKPDYITDVFFDIRWRWDWAFNRRPVKFDDWHPVDIRSACIRCDGPLEIEAIGGPNPETRVLCRDGCPVVSVPERSERIIGHVRGKIEREWRRTNAG